MHAASPTAHAESHFAILIDVVSSLARTGVDVFCWRTEQLEDAGYNAPAALRLAASHHVDLHDARRLAAAGCPQELALRILS